ncbi:polysaccharide pyruvyl transferase family protein [Qingshengfaniella alkalisoli]|uniref:polysaccharide pyruvyl transferase family protein n=1 Tax=Qingshengfaniella alkalisoli TaxID=2599296 RepID=UPI00143E01AD|nr:polysaccharide pyruvyl transferase family protein [Qingshengfaniella alkalisoli]
MKIALLGQFGSGNFGNDGSLEAMVGVLKRECPSPDLICICSNPDVVRERLGIEAISISATAPRSRLFSVLDRVALGVPGKLRTLLAAWYGCKGVDAVIIPGTGILDDFQDHAFGWPYVLLRWCVAARLRGASLALVSIGAGPIHGRLSRWFLTRAAKLSTYRSYRDDRSRSFMSSIGVKVSNDPVYPDLAFSLPSPESVTAGPPTICLGLMTYCGWRKGAPQSRSTFDEYLDKIEVLVGGLVAKGWRVRLLGGDASDIEALEATLERVDRSGELRQQGIITAPQHCSLMGIKSLISDCDAVIATRFHNVVCALSMMKPTLSIGYADKNDVVLERAGLGSYCHHIETFEPKDILSGLDDLLAEREQVVWHISRFLQEAQADLSEQEEHLYAMLGLVPAPAKRTHPSVENAHCSL